MGLLIHLLVVRAVQAHAELVSADPAPGAMVAASPTTIWLEFSEPLRPGSEVVLYGTGFRAVTGVQSVVDLTQPTRLVATLPALSPDNYTVQWTSVSVDGDTLSGSYAFGVQVETQRSGPLFNLLAAVLLILVLLAMTLAVRRRRRARAV